jgi:hypothetical protein
VTCDNVVTLRPREDAPPRRNFASMQVRGVSIGAAVKRRLMVDSSMSVDP